MELAEVVREFADALKRVDGKHPIAVNSRTGEHFQPGIGPHPEAAAIELIADELRSIDGFRRIAIAVPYPESPRKKCDLCVLEGDTDGWAIEIKLFRPMGDNGRPNDNMLMHILSPYAEHRSALTDCEKLRGSAIARRKAVVIFGFESMKSPLETGIAAFETLAAAQGRISVRCESRVSHLVHPVHQEACVYGWEVLA